MINPIPTLGEGGMVFVRLKDSSAVALMNKCPGTAADRRPSQAKSDLKTGKNENISETRQIKQKYFQQAITMVM